MLPSATVAAVLVVVGAACRGGDSRVRFVAQSPEEELRQYESMGPRYEARAWLAANRNPSPFASNRFGSAEGAAAFIDSLYGFGAETVYVLNVETDSSEGGPYADAMLLRLPGDSTARGRIFEIDAREARHEGFDPDRDTGQRYLYFWWD